MNEAGLRMALLQSPDCRMRNSASADSQRRVDNYLEQTGGREVTCSASG
jgi:hypothetical protein